MSVGSSPPGGVFGGGGALGQLISILQTIAQNIGFLSKQVGNSFVSLSTANTFTAAQTFTPPPVIEAGATGTGTFIPSGAISKQFAASGVGNGADTTDDTLFTYSLPASSLDVAGRTLRVRAFGQDFLRHQHRSDLWRRHHERSGVDCGIDDRQNWIEHANRGGFCRIGRNPGHPGCPDRDGNRHECRRDQGHGSLFYNRGCK